MQEGHFDPNRPAPRMPSSFRRHVLKGRLLSNDAFGKPRLERRRHRRSLGPLEVSTQTDVVSVMAGHPVLQRTLRETSAAPFEMVSTFVVLVSVLQQFLFRRPEDVLYSRCIAVIFAPRFPGWN